MRRGDSLVNLAARTMVIPASTLLGAGLGWLVYEISY
jgi:hypothetical protein